MESLVTDKERAETLGKSAYQTIAGMWNAEHAAEELLRICKEWMGSGKLAPAADGPLSKAGIISPRF